MFVKIASLDLKKEIMKKKKELADKTSDDRKKLEIMNFKTQEQILFEIALRQGKSSVMPNGN